jgi:AcrR family transcriptional regulator
MQTPARRLRSQEEDRAKFRFEVIGKDRERHELILASAAHLMALNGRNAVTLGNFAIALRMAPSTIRRLFADLDCLLAEILRNHLTAISNEMAKIPDDVPDKRAARRAVYLKYTRGPFGAYTEEHLLLVRDRATLPPDLLEPLEDLRFTVGMLMDHEVPGVVLGLLDVQGIAIQQVEAALAATPRGKDLVPDLTPEQHEALWADPPPKPKPEPCLAPQYIRDMYAADRARAAQAGATAAMAAAEARAGPLAAAA